MKTIYIYDNKIFDKNRTKLKSNKGAKKIAKEKYVFRRLHNAKRYYFENYATGEDLSALRPPVCFWQTSIVQVNTEQGS